MKYLLPLISFIALLGILIPPLLFFGGTIQLATMKHAMLLATLAWFLTAPFWVKKEHGSG